MKTLKRISLCLLFVFVFVISFLPTNFAFADTQIYRPPKISNTNRFSLSVQANNRLSNVEMTEDIRELSPYESSLVKFYCFKWRDLESLDLQISSNIMNSFKAFSLFYFTFLSLSTFFAKKSFETSLISKIPLKHSPISLDQSGDLRAT